jgi:hypothetical protein
MAAEMRTYGVIKSQMKRGSLPSEELWFQEDE